MKRLICALMLLAAPAVAEERHDVLVNCIANQLRKTPYHIWPVVYAPPLYSAEVLMYKRGAQFGGEPEAVIRIVTSDDVLSIDVFADDAFPGLTAAYNAIRYCRARKP